MSRVIVVRTLVAVVTLAMAAAVVAAIVVLGPPSQQRLFRLDARRVADLTMLSQAINSYAREHEALPADLAALTQAPGPRTSRFDPQTRAAYEYTVTTSTSYTLCAVFSAPSPDVPPVPIGPGGDDWIHGAGRQCFERKEALGKK